jgi:uncharacterized protein
MVVEFSVKNFRSIKEMQTISFSASGLKSSEDNAAVDQRNIVEDGGTNLMKTVGIYGANGSGKSNLVKALEYFLRAIKNEPSPESNLNLLCDPFLYQDDPADKESFFQMVLIIDEKRYRYGFTTKRNPKFTVKEPNKLTSKEVIVSEWLFGTKEKNQGEYFTREYMGINKEKLPHKEKIPPLPYEHTLFLTHAAAFDKDGVCASVRSFISGWTISNFDGFDKFRYSSIFLINEIHKKQLFLDFLASFNLKYNDIKIEKDEKKPNSLEVPLEKIFFTKTFKNNRNEDQVVNLNLGLTESFGTQRLFDIAGLLLLAFDLKNNVFIILDEVDSNFHPSLLIKLIGLFNDPAINKNKSQLLFTSHDTNLMSPSIMRRDQFYFTEKNEDQSTRLYSLADLKGIRNDADFAREYLRGYYGALPILSELSKNLFSEIDESVGT